MKYMTSSKRERRVVWAILIVLLLAIVAVGGLRASVAASNTPTTIQWSESGVPQSLTFTGTAGFWLAWAEGPQTTIGWTTGTSTQQFHQFNPDGNAWSVNTVRGDLNGDGTLNLFDIIIGLQCIVGITEC